MKALFEVHIQNGEMSKLHRSIFLQEWRKLADGWYKIGIELASGYFKRTRYKYYFDCVLGLALPAASKVYEIIEHGEPHPVRNTNELHEICKILFNPAMIIDTNTGQVISHASSTTKLSDRDFIGNYMEQVMAHFASPPFNVEYIDYEEWKHLHETGEWHETKFERTTTAKAVV